jgi:hypothetical protein
MQILETIKQEFLTELANSTTIGGSLYTREDVGQIIGIFVERVAAAEQPPRPASIDADTIKAIALIAERWAVNHAQNCAENYEFDENIEFHTNEYRGELNVTASLDVDTHSLARSATFHTSLVEAELRELLTPNVTPPNTETNA